MIGIYCITNLKNGKKYIGQSVNIKRRLREHHSQYRQKTIDTPLYKAFSKYGIENFLFECIVQCPVDDLDVLEKFYVEKHKTYQKKFGYNLTVGGKGYSGKFSNKHRENISKGLKGKKRPSPTKETLLKRSESLRKVKHTEEWHRKIGDKHKGKTISSDVRLKISESLKKYFSKNGVSEETRAKLAETSKGKSHSEDVRIKISQKVSKPVLQFSLDGVFIAEYPSAREATKVTKVCFTSISSCCSGKYGSAGGFIWEHKYSAKRETQ